MERIIKNSSKKLTTLFVLTALFTLFALVGTVLALSFPETQLAPGPSEQFNPSISGDYVVWQDNGNSGDIYMYRISTGAVTPVVTDAGAQENPAISGDYIVWQDLRDFNWDVYMRQILPGGSLGPEVQVTNAASNQAAPAIYGDYIVWDDNRAFPNYDIYLHLISGAPGSETRVSMSGRGHYPAVSGDYIIWQDNRSGIFGDYDIYMRQVSAGGVLGSETQVTANASSQENPAISGDYIVWQDNRNGNWDVYMRQILPGGSLGPETPLTTNTSDQINPAISGGYIVWEDQRSGTWNIYMYQISTGAEFAVTTIGGNQRDAAISGDSIVWDDYRNGDNRDIYMTRMTQDEQLPSVQPGTELPYTGR